MTGGRRIAHIDMDAFFASCELLQYPELRGKPVVVAGRSTHAPRRNNAGDLEFSRLRDYVGRGVLTTATYEARALGVHSAMPTMKAARLAPDAILLPVNFDLYRKYSRLFKDAVRSISPIVEDIGIDEVYADVSLLEGESEQIARSLKSAVHAATGLTCSVGLAPNKLLAKLASDMHKPDGITIIRMEDLPSRIWPMSANKINGIGPKSFSRLQALDIHTIGDLAEQAESWLVEHFGASYGRWLYRVSHGLDERPVVTHSEPVSMSRETTFERDLHAVSDKIELGRILTRLCTQLAADLLRKNYYSRRISIKLRFNDFSTVTRDMALPVAISEAMEIRAAAGQCLKRVNLERSIRLIGVKASALQKSAGVVLNASQQLPLDLDGF
ncbi:DNA polymerase IV [Herbaspirillum sp. B65]|uniref:DNA polymerase IV n=1 Tax=Herbaspirillum sp. B65 TaxID=137708 RepID=UPI0003493D28|nr:DNA polymerase IV [Herbaspirillum sp. B65]